jgi:26S proteasome regulatory subunit N1
MQGISIELDEEMIDNEEQRELLQELISNSKLSEGYLTLARDLDVMEPKTPDDLYKV